MASYLKVRWDHDDSEDPFVLYYELDDHRMEVRCVEVFEDGRVLRADTVDPEAETSLGWEPFPSLDYIREQPEFTVSEISELEFERVWVRGSAV